MVKVDHAEAERQQAGGGPPLKPRAKLVEMAAVGDAGELVGVGDVGKFVVARLHFGIA